MKLAVCFLLVAAATACPGVSKDFAEHIGHAIHSITLEDLQKFNKNTPLANGVPTVNMNLTAAQKVFPNAPSVPIGDHFATEAFNIIDWVLTHQDTGDDGLGPNWLPQERLVHMFHMKDLWARIQSVYTTLHRVQDDTCSCLLDTENNGIQGRLEYIAEQYAVDTPISLHDWGTKIPKLTDSKTWKEWNKRFSYYYTVAGDRDPAVFLACALSKF